MFVSAVQRARGVDPRVRGLVVGGGPEQERLKELAGNDGVVQVLGQRLDVPDIINAADVSCLSSPAEGVPMSVLEAMASAKPVIATDVGGLGEADTTGILMPVGDEEAFVEALLKLASDPEFARRLGGAGRKRHRAVFSLERMATEYSRAFEEVVGISLREP